MVASRRDRSTVDRTADWREEVDSFVASGRGFCTLRTTLTYSLPPILLDMSVSSMGLSRCPMQVLIQLRFRKSQACDWTRGGTSFGCLPPVDQRTEFAEPSDEVGLAGRRSLT